MSVSRGARTTQQSHRARLSAHPSSAVAAQPRLSHRLDVADGRSTLRTIGSLRVGRPTPPSEGGSLRVDRPGRVSEGGSLLPDRPGRVSEAACPPFAPVAPPHRPGATLPIGRLPLAGGCRCGATGPMIASHPLELITRTERRSSKRRSASGSTGRGRRGIHTRWLGRRSLDIRRRG